MITTASASIILALCLGGVIYLSFAVNYVSDEKKIRKMGQLTITLLMLAVVITVHLYVEGMNIFLDAINTLL